jgi:hypothetical protein
LLFALNQVDDTTRPMIAAATPTTWMAAGVFAILGIVFDDGDR